MPLHSAVNFNSIQVVKYLIQKQEEHKQCQEEQAAAQQQTLLLKGK